MAFFLTFQRNHVYKTAQMINSEIKRQKNALNLVKQQELVNPATLSAHIVLDYQNPVAWAVILDLFMTNPPTSVFQPVKNAF